MYNLFRFCLWVFPPFTTERTGISFENRTILGGRHDTKFRPATTANTPEALLPSSGSIEKNIKK